MTRIRPTVQDQKDAADFRFYEKNAGMFQHFVDMEWVVYPDSESQEEVATFTGLRPAVARARELKEKADG